jgi:hypothetical protein
MNDDFINGAFQVVAAVMVLNNVRALHRDREVRGVSIASIAFFFLYGVWNLRYFPLLGQWWSFAGGVLVTLANCLCVGMMIYYTYFRNARSIASAGTNLQANPHNLAREASIS